MQKEMMYSNDIWEFLKQNSERPTFITQTDLGGCGKIYEQRMFSKYRIKSCLCCIAERTTHAELLRRNHKYLEDGGKQFKYFLKFVNFFLLCLFV